MSEDAKQLAQRQFGAHAENYVTSAPHAAGENLARLVDLVNPQPGWRVLDVATGGGHTALAVAQRGAWTVAGDLTRPMLHATRQHLGAKGQPGVQYVQLDAEQLPFADESFDALTCRIAPHHFPDVAQFVRESARVIRRGGIVGVVDQLTPGDPKTARYINAFERLRDPSHVWAYGQVEWEGFFTGAGLHRLHFEDADTWHDLIPWAERMGCDAATITRLQAMLVHAPEFAAAWMKPANAGTPGARFVIRQFILVGWKE